MNEQFETTKKEMVVEGAKLFASAFVGGCACAVTSMILGPMVNACAPGGLIKCAAVDKAVKVVGVSGISALVGNKVSEDTHETIEAACMIVQISKTKLAMRKEANAGKMEEMKSKFQEGE